MSLFLFGPKRIYVVLLFYQRVTDSRCTLYRSLAQIDRTLGGEGPGYYGAGCELGCRPVIEVRWYRLLWERLIGLSAYPNNLVSLLACIHHHFQNAHGRARQTIGRQRGSAFPKRYGRSWPPCSQRMCICIALGAGGPVSLIAAVPLPFFTSSGREANGQP